MNYTEQKAKDLCYIIGAIRMPSPESDIEKKIVQIIENRIKEIIRDTRHKCAENALEALSYGDDEFVGLADKINLAVMNTSLDN